MEFKYISLNVLIVISVVISGSDGRLFAHTKGELELTKKVVIDGQPCNDIHLSVSLFILSAARSQGKYYEKRVAVRDTWAQDMKNYGISHYFVVALNRNQTINTELRREADTYGDILQFGFIDDYHNLTLKAISILRWIQTKCLHSTYILKTDDDVMVNVRQLSTDLKRFPTGISGQLLIGSKSKRDYSREL